MKVVARIEDSREFLAIRDGRQEARWRHGPDFELVKDAAVVKIANQRLRESLAPVLEAPASYPQYAHIDTE